MTDVTMQKLRKLSPELRSLKQQMDSFNEEAKQCAEKRDTLHKQIKDLRLEAAKARERRDATNTRVKALKIQRDQTRVLIKEKIEESKQLKGKLRLLDAKKPKQTADTIRKEKEEIEWNIQTTSLTLQEEKPLVEKANRLQIQLNTYQQINNKKEQIVELQNEIKVMNEEARLFHKRLSELAHQSQELHEKMIETINKATTLQTEADNYHQSFLQSEQKSQESHGEYMEIKKKSKTLRKELAEAEEKEKKLRQEETRKKLKAKALEKLEQGKKLTFEEFKLLAEEETT